MLDSLLELWPSPPAAVAGMLSGLTLYLAAGMTAATLRERGWRVGDTRKIFHLTIFTVAALLRWQFNSGAVAAYGAVVAAGVLFATWQGSRSRIFLALARPSDAPHERLHVLSPLICTAVGGVLAHLIAGPLAGVAYLIAGWGDAVGEPVGIRWGRHRYRVPSIGTITAERSWEGSFAVCVASTLAAGLGLLLAGKTGPDVIAWSMVLGCAAVVIEAASPHGWDNFTLLVGTACLTRWCVG